MVKKTNDPEIIALRGGPMDGYLVTPDAPALKPDWPSVPGHPGHYKATGRDEVGTRVAVWTASEATDASPEEIQGALEQLLAAVSPLTGNIVDLDLFAGGEVLYKIKDVRGKEQKYPLPADPPFETALAFFRAHDAWELAAQRLSEAKIALDRARGPAEIAKLRARETRQLEEWAQAWGRCIDAFLPLVQILTPKVKREDLALAIGQTALEHWMRVAIFRFNQGRTEQALQEAIAPKEPENRAQRRRKSRAKSPSSA